jgi:hypothetical protein
MKKTYLDKYLKVLQEKDEREIVKFLIQFIPMFHGGKVRKYKDGVRVTFSNGKKFYIEISQNSSNWKFYDIKEKVVQMPSLLFVYDGDTMEFYKELNIDELNEKIINISLMLKK